MNLTRLAQEMGLDEEECREIVHLFIETTISDVENLKRAVQMKDFALAVQSSHSIKGASANLGFDEISEIAKGAEMNARRSVLEGAPEAADLILGCIEGIKGSLDS